MIALSGSRGTLIFGLFPFVSFVLTELISGMPRRVARASALGLLMPACFLITFTIVFPEALDTMSERQTSAVDEEGSTAGRMLFIATEFTGVLDSTPLFGFGAGLGTNAGSFLALGTRDFRLAEYEWTRIAQEFGPLIGPSIVGARIIATMFLCWASIRCARNANNVPLIIFGFAGPLLLIGQFSTQNTILSFNWLGLGFLLAAMRLSPTQSQNR
jgi:hypothetical protein